MDFGEEVNAFSRAANSSGVRMLMIGGGAVNFHGYQRQSADLDFWMEPTPLNFDRLSKALTQIGMSSMIFQDQCCVPSRTSR